MPECPSRAAQELRVLMGENLCYQHSNANYLPEIAEILFSRGQLRIEDVRRARGDLDEAAEELQENDGDPDESLDRVLEKDKLLKLMLPPIETLQGKVSNAECPVCWREDVDPDENGKCHCCGAVVSCPPMT